MGSSPKQPAPPDYSGLARQQALLDQQAMDRQTIANRPDQHNPLGSLTWRRDPTTGQWSQTESWDPRVEQMFNSSLSMQQQRMNEVQQLMNRGDFQYQGQQPQFSPYQMNTGQYQGTNLNVQNFNPSDWNSGDFTSDVLDRLPTYDQASGDAFADKYADSLLARIAPQQQKDQAAMENKLRMQGLQPGTEAYNRAYQNLLTSQGDVTAQAKLQGQLAGSQESRSVYNTQLQGALARAGEERNIYNTNLQGQQARSQNTRDNYATMLNEQLARAEHGRSEYATSLTGDAAHAANNAQNYNLSSADDKIRYERAMAEYMLPWQQNQLAQQSGASVLQPNFQNFATSGASNSANMAGASQQQYAQQMQNYNDAVATRTAKGSSWGSVIGGVVGTMAGGNTAAGAAIGGAAGGAMFSDVALKDDIETISDKECYDLMEKLIPKKWHWNGTSIQDMGVSAQQVQEHLPNLVRRGEHGVLTVNYTKLFAILLGAFRHLAAKEAKNGRVAG